LLVLVLLGGIASLGLFVAGFVWFLNLIEWQDTPFRQSANAIVVLTGGADRISEATDLLAQGRGERLLITGVHPDTTLQEIGQTVPSARRVLECCVDIGRSALNTRGNAIETADWIRQHRFRSLIVVTSAWHMPRALVELRRVLGSVELVPYPVVTDRMRETPWWSLPTTRLLLVEYLKFLLAQARIRTSPAVAAAGAEPST